MGVLRLWSRIFSGLLFLVALALLCFSLYMLSTKVTKLGIALACLSGVILSMSMAGMCMSRSDVGSRILTVIFIGFLTALVLLQTAALVALFFYYDKMLQFLKDLDDTNDSNVDAFDKQLYIMKWVLLGLYAYQLITLLLVACCFRVYSRREPSLSEEPLLGAEMSEKYDLDLNHPDLPSATPNTDRRRAEMAAKHGRSINKWSKYESSVSQRDDTDY